MTDHPPTTAATGRRDPLPFAALGAAGAAVLRARGPAGACREALGALDSAEALDIAALTDAGDPAALTRRLRHIAGGSLRAGRADKALAAKTLELAGAEQVSSAVRTPGATG